MRATQKPGRRGSQPSTAPLGAESPHSFFRLRQAQPQYVHQTFIKWLGQAGLCVGSLERFAAHPVWRARLRRGQVAPGQEALVVRQVIRDVAARFGVALPMKEIAVVVQTDRIMASFVFNNGRPGTLVLRDHHEQWLGDPEK